VTPDAHSARPSSSRADIVLTICPPWDIEAPPLGIGFLHSYLSAKGFSPALLDLNVEIYNRMSAVSKASLFDFGDFTKWENDYESETESFEPHVKYSVERVLSFRAPVVGFSLYHSNMNPSIRIITRLKEVSPETIIILGGASCTDRFDRQHLPYDAADYIVLGEGELPLEKILPMIKNGHPIEGEEGIVTTEEGLLQAQCIAPHIADLDQIPFPTYKGLDLSLYTTPGMTRIMGSRGCICRCTFCNETYWVKRFRYRSGRHIVEEMNHSHITNGYEHFKFSDLVFNGNLKALDEKCDLLIQHGKPIYWHGQGVLRKDMAPELLRKMFDAGCRSIDYGLEAGSDSVLKRMKKPYTTEIASQVMQHTVKAGIHCGVNIIVGFPGETEEEFQETLDFLASNKSRYHKIANLSTCLITPHSDLDNNPDKYGIHIPQVHDFWFKWEDTLQEGNATNALRKEKLRRVIDFAKQEGISIDYVYEH
jgi:radical SAM superfamily enzyme YgiQ (UPF0313 family)